MNHYTPELIERFWSRVDRSGGFDACWIWTGAKTKDGYGHFRSGAKDIYSHRFSYEITFGALPARNCACHRCDTPICCNPFHIFPGTMADNMADRDEKGRVGIGYKRRSLTAEQAEEIRTYHAENVHTQREIAQIFGVDPSIVSSIVNNKTYRSEGI